jgi:hypothetical protein
VIEVGGSRYSLWDADYFDKIEKGDEVQFEYKQAGKFKNIVKIHDGSETEPGNGGNSGNYTENNGFANGSSGEEYGSDRLTKMVRMSCLKSASPLIAGTKVAYDDRADKTIELASKFEKYINGDIGMEPIEPIEPEQP